MGIGFLLACEVLSKALVICFWASGALPSRGSLILSSSCAKIWRTQLYIFKANFPSYLTNCLLESGAWRSHNVLEARKKLEFGDSPWVWQLHDISCREAEGRCTPFWVTGIYSWGCGKWESWDGVKARLIGILTKSAKLAITKLRSTLRADLI